MGLAGCAAPIRHEYRLAPGRAHAPDQAHALLLPINESERIPRGLEKGEDEVFASVVAYLEGQGITVRTVETDRYRDAAAAAFREARRRAEAGLVPSIAGSPRFGDLVPLLVGNLGVEADLVIVPNMALRVGESSGRSVKWDGVRRTDPGVGVQSRITGSRRSGASLFVAIYEPDGTRVFSGYGGLDVVFQANRREARFDLIEDRLEDLDNIREGVCVAFHPYFGEDESCR